MHGDIQSSFLWEDMNEVQSRLEKALATLQALQRAIQDGRMNQPTRQDSNRLNRLVVLAELLYSETRPWIEEHVEALPPGNNGQRPSPAPAP